MAELMTGMFLNKEDRVTREDCINVTSDRADAIVEYWMECADEFNKEFDDNMKEALKTKDMT